MFLLDETRAALVQLVKTLKAIQELCEVATNKLNKDMFTITFKS